MERGDYYNDQHKNKGYITIKGIIEGRFQITNEIIIREKSNGEEITFLWDSRIKIDKEDWMIPLYMLDIILCDNTPERLEGMFRDFLILSKKINDTNLSR